MNRLLVGVAALASAALLLAVGSPGVAGSARSNTKEDAPAGCAASEGTDRGVASSAPLGGMAGTDAVRWPAGSRSPQSMEELRDRLARTPSGGSLMVQAGVYRGTLVIDHPVTFVGIGHPILQGDGTGTVLTIRVAGTTVRDLNPLEAGRVLMVLASGVDAVSLGPFGAYLNDTVGTAGGGRLPGDVDRVVVAGGVGGDHAS